MELGRWIAVEWTGEDDVPREKSIRAAAEITAKSDLKLRATEPFDAVRQTRRESRD